MISTNKKTNFHSLELTICGHSGSGKTTLIKKLIQKFSCQYDIGYIKHDAHGFELDHPGKDTYEIKKSGAKTVAINSKNQHAYLTDGEISEYFYKQNLIDLDLIFIEGHKNSLNSKILVWNGSQEDQDLLKRYKEFKESSLLAIVGQQLDSPDPSVPYFQRDDVTAISEFIQNFWQHELNKRPLYGLILGGGQSKRMGQDKTALIYQGKNQLEHLSELLQKHTEKVFVSCRKDQLTADHLKNFHTIEDRYLEMGPTGGILSAFKKFPEASWLVLACDMPYIEEKALVQLIDQRDPFKLATCFHNVDKNWPEPLCAIYEPKAALKLGLFLMMGKPCPRKVLMNSNIKSLHLEDPTILNNINTLEEFKIAQQDFIQMESKAL
jgi:molybdopterin-guanine dinucleotide biosynthesis protein MobB